MEIRVGQNALVGAVKAAALAVDGKGRVPVLANVLLRAEGGKLTVQGTDLSTTITATAACEGAIEITVPAKGFRDAVERAYARKRGRKAAGAVDPVVTVTVQGTSVTVKGDGESTIPGTPVSEFPPAPGDVDGFPTFYVGAALRGALEYALPAVSRDECRFHLNGVCFSGGDVVATDGHRLHRVSGLPSIEGERIVSARTATALLKVLKDGDGDVTAAFAGGHCSFSVGSVKVCAKLVDAQFPPYDQVIPERYVKRVNVTCAPLVSALERAKPIAGKSRGVKVEARGEQVTVSADDPDKGAFSQVVPGNVRSFEGCADADHYVTGFNPSYMLDAIDSQPDENLTFLVGSSLEPARLDSLGPANTVRTAVIMPMRI